VQELTAELEHQTSARSDVQKRDMEERGKMNANLQKVRGAKQ
jgi:hypothetical protein